MKEYKDLINSSNREKEDALFALDQYFDNNIKETGDIPARLSILAYDGKRLIKYQTEVSQYAGNFGWEVSVEKTPNNRYYLKITRGDTK